MTFPAYLIIVYLIFLGLFCVLKMNKVFALLISIFFISSSPLLATGNGTTTAEKITDLHLQALSEILSWLPLHDLPKVNLTNRKMREVLHHPGTLFTLPESYAEPLKDKSKTLQEWFSPFFKAPQKYSRIKLIIRALRPENLALINDQFILDALMKIEEVDTVLAIAAYASSYFSSSMKGFQSTKIIQAFLNAGMAAEEISALAPLITQLRESLAFAKLNNNYLTDLILAFITSDKTNKELSLHIKTCNALKEKLFKKLNQHGVKMIIITLLDKNYSTDDIENLAHFISQNHDKIVELIGHEHYYTQALLGLIRSDMEPANMQDFLDRIANDEELLSESPYERTQYLTTAAAS